MWNEKVHSLTSRKPQFVSRDADCLQFYDPHATIYRPDLLLPLITNSRKESFGELCLSPQQRGFQSVVSHSYRMSFSMSVSIGHSPETDGQIDAKIEAEDFVEK
ncbi:hypothetical protein RRG08_041419 [Elysia crispata]|uniref:Uncharacterized protein n=1 Tax=Elysia crispata TaxID=231223 RepID=A0AAE0XRF5_9GAST|nr:hypothetical protein RRG08_041419 [Elysia crispata]